MFRDSQESRPIAFYNSILDVPICILTVNAASRVLRFLHLDHFLGYQPEDIPDLPALFKILSPHDAPVFNDLLRSEGQGVQNVQMQNKDGLWEWVQCRPYHRQSGTQGSDITLILVPVSGLKVMTRVLLESESKFRFVVRQAPVGIVIVDREGRVSEFNRAMETITGYGAQESFGKALCEFLPPLSPAPELACEENEQQVRQALQTGRAEWFGVATERVLHRKDGAPRWVMASFFPIQAERGISIGIIVEDISEQHQAEQRIREQAQHLQVLNSITRMALESSSLDEMLAVLARQVSEMLNAAGCYITLWDHQKNMPYPAAGCGSQLGRFLGFSAQPGQPTLTATVLEADHALFIHNYQRTGYVDDPQSQPSPTNSIFCLPLKVAGQKLGALMVDFWQVPPNFEREQVAQWEIVASQLSLAIYKSLLLEQERRRRQQAEALQQAIAAPAADIDLEQVLDNIQKGMEQVLPFDLATISLWTDEKTLRLVALRPKSGGMLPILGSSFPIEATVLALWRENEPQLIVEDIQARPYPGFATAQYHPNIRSYLAVRLNARGKPIGFITLGSRQPGFYSAEQAQLLQPFADQSAIAIENARLFEQVLAGRERLQHLSRRLVEVQETERRRLALELHDEIGQELTALNYFLEMSRKAEGDAQHEFLAEAQTQVQRLTSQVREMSLSLHPNVLDDLGLQPGLEWLIRRYQAQTQVKVHHHFEGLERRFALALETAVFRVVQEALTNVARHAQTREVLVIVQHQAGSLMAEVIDDGIGFDPDIINDHDQAFGIAGMNERVRLAGGQFEIRAARGTGTRVRAVFPVRAENGR